MTQREKRVRKQKERSEAILAALRDLPPLEPFDPHTIPGFTGSASDHWQAVVWKANR